MTNGPRLISLVKGQEINVTSYLKVRCHQVVSNKPLIVPNIVYGTVTVLITNTAYAVFQDILHVLTHVISSVTP
jgi:hypothetical protein